MAGCLVKSLQEDLKSENDLRTKGIGETLQNYVRRAELSHMESPEADQQLLTALDAKVDDLFSRIPLPEDPMKAALALTEEELKEEAAAELVKEAVREMYWRKLDAKQAEELRLKKAHEKLRSQGADQYFEELRGEERLRERAHVLAAGQAATSATVSPASRLPQASRQDNGGEEASAAELREELAAMKAKMARLERLLRERE